MWHSQSLFLATSAKQKPQLRDTEEFSKKKIFLIFFFCVYSGFLWSVSLKLYFFFLFIFFFYFYLLLADILFLLRTTRCDWFCFLGLSCCLCFMLWSTIQQEIGLACSSPPHLAPLSSCFQLSGRWWPVRTSLLITINRRVVKEPAKKETASQ